MSLHNNNYDNHNDAAAELPEATADLRSQEFSADEAGFDVSADMDIDADIEASGEVNGFEAMNLNPALLQAVAALGYTQPTAVFRRKRSLLLRARWWRLDGVEPDR